MAQQDLSEPIKKQIRVIDDKTNLNERYGFLKDVIKNHRIMALGEQTHTPDESFKIRVELIQYLLENEGFEVIIFEAGMFDLHLANKKVKKSRNISHLQSSLYWFWGNTVQHKKLFRYLRTKLKNGQNIDFAGFDVKPPSNQNALKNTYVKALREQLLNGIDHNDSKFQEYMTTVTAIEENRKKGGVHLLVFEMTEKQKKRFLYLSQHFQKVLLESGNHYWSQIIRTVDEGVVLYADYSIQKAALDPNLLLGMNNQRDRLMAENLKYLLNEVYGDKKVILIGANYHFAKDVSKISPSNAFSYDVSKAITTGQILKSELKEKIFTIGFMAPENIICWEKRDLSRTSLGCMQKDLGYKIAYHPLYKWNLEQPNVGSQRVIKLFSPKSPSKHPNWNEVMDAVILMEK